ncbi:tRNA pseudouridine(38-40) synthase TruA [Ichthyenterobacterium sp. W332]|uniref:tRNA pseudouridine synthase A n=1 Tax=Microcosmobacter mediterraneus TaxID=3075607 RepID=A0ABU2YFR7_9FLAO|nr:tRNA pseudouridine(38-40) synthase TruA [Ichthyenterobacterium sp. W332]MDT0557013.1 tRNA pseudouridine(38-40) synthase TruA [Ichthyenterobacterium sp. W332]
MRYFIELSYKGTNYHGWQNQPNAISLQEVIENALSTLLNSKIPIVGAGRTDAGVHARQMFAHFDFETEFDYKQLVFKLNSYLPKDIAIIDIFPVDNDTHARFSATARSYIYKISNVKNPFSNELSYQMQLPLNIEAMNMACKKLLGYKDFQCFSKSNTDVKTYNCDIKYALWTQKDSELEFKIEADRFLRNMVRAIVGTLLNIGLGKLEVNDLDRILESKNRSEAGYSVPAHGLYLTKVNYPESIKT